MQQFTKAASTKRQDDHIGLLRRRSQEPDGDFNDVRFQRPRGGQKTRSDKPPAAGDHKRRTTKVLMTEEPLLTLWARDGSQGCQRREESRHEAQLGLDTAQEDGSKGVKVRCG